MRHLIKKVKLINKFQFITGSLLVVSEYLPFTDSKSNGILHSIKNIVDEYKNDFRN
jgi:hypothetical protein